MKKILLAFLSLAAIYGCGSPPPDTAPVVINIGDRAMASASIPRFVSSISFTVSAADMVTMQRVVSVENRTSISEKFDVPVGNDRRFIVVAQAYNGRALYGGEAYASIGSSPVTLNVELKLIDSAAPTQPYGLRAVAASPTQVNITWRASTDDTGVQLYKVYRDGFLVGSPTDALFSDTGLYPSKKYCYSVLAVDLFENESELSAPTCVYTKSLLAVWAWGDNAKGQLGNGSTVGTNLPVETVGIVGSFDIRRIASGAEHGIALTSTGGLRAWGANYYGQLGDQTTTVRTTQVEVTGISNVTAVSAGKEHSVAIKSDGTGWAWGRNDFGQLGDPFAGGYETWPKQVQATGVVFKKVSAGYNHNLAVASDGKVWAWGYNISGQLGDGTTEKRSEAVQTVGLINAVAVAAGEHHSLALTSAGEVWAWGSNSKGQLGDGSGVTQLTPVKVGISNVISIAAGMNHSLALTADGRVWAWGYNYIGQLGTGNTQNSATPTPVKDPSWGNFLSGVKAIAAGMSHSFAVTSNWGLLAWGDNSYGQLGTGTYNPRSVPTAVWNPLADAAFEDCYEIQAGDRFSMAIVLIDKIPPSAPPKLSATAASPSRVDLAWIASTDDIGLSGYRVLRNGQAIAMVPGTAYSDTQGLQSGLEYCYEIAALDLRGNESPPSVQKCATVQ